MDRWVQVLYGLPLTAFQELALTRKLNSLQAGTTKFSSSPSKGLVASCTDREWPDTLIMPA